jgi:hypothetical protein
LASVQSQHGSCVQALAAPWLTMTSCRQASLLLAECIETVEGQLLRLAAMYGGAGAAQAQLVQSVVT